MAKETTAAHLSRHDREIASIRKLVLAGMKLVVSIERAQKKTEEAQKKTELTLERFIRSLERGSGNGHTKGKIS